MLNREIFYTLAEAKFLIERWRQHYNEIRPHSALGYRPPAPAAIVLHSASPGFAIQGLRPARPRTETDDRLT